MMIYGYLITYIDSSNGKEYKYYGFVAAESRADAVREVENTYTSDYTDITEVSIHSVADDEDGFLIDRCQIDFFINAAQQNGYGED